jgi:hypothetical protein
MNKADLEKHVKILGWIHIVSSVLFLLFGLGMGAFMLFAGILSNHEDLFDVFAVIAIFLTGLLSLIGLAAAVAGVGLLKRKKWSRILAIIVGLMNITYIPIGTAIGVYTIYVLLNDSAAAYFE